MATFHELWPPTSMGVYKIPGVEGGGFSTTLFRAPKTRNSPFNPTLFLFKLSIACLNKASPPVVSPLTSNCSHSIGTLMASKISLTLSVISAPIPSPGMRVQANLPMDGKAGWSADSGIGEIEGEGGILTAVLHGHLTRNEPLRPCFSRGNDHARLTLDLALGELVSENALRAEAGISCTNDTRSVPTDRLGQRDTHDATHDVGLGGRLGQQVGGASGLECGSEGHVEGSFGVRWMGGREGRRNEAW